MGVYKAEYIWLDGTEPVKLLRSKTKIIQEGKEPPVWGFDGSSTNQAVGSSSDCVLDPVFITPDPVRGGNNKLVLCEVMTTEMQPHVTNTRAQCRQIAEKHADADMWFGLEQEYTLFRGRLPLGWPDRGFPAPQGDYYCGVGGDVVFGRPIVEQHLDACLAAGLGVSGINAEVMPGQWEFQIGPLDAVAVSDHIHVARWLLCRIAEEHGANASWEAKPVKGDWNGAGCHTNFSTAAMRESYEACIEACEKLRATADLHISNYGDAIEERLTGEHETQSYKTFSYGVSDRGASVRIPWQVHKEQRGYVEDRRPNANCDPYVVTRLMLESVCG